MNVSLAVQNSGCRARLGVIFNSSELMACILTLSLLVAHFEELSCLPQTLCFILAIGLTGMVQDLDENTLLC